MLNTVAVLVAAADIKGNDYFVRSRLANAKHFVLHIGPANTQKAIVFAAAAAAAAVRA